MDDNGIDSITLGGGCFWCTEAAYQQIIGVTKVVSGYAGGDVPNPSYEAVCTGRTGHAEVVQVSFNTNKISLEQILDVFWVIHNPTTLNSQGHDFGTQYRSIILYANNEQKLVANESIKRVRPLWADQIVTQVEPLYVFYPAEAFHQNYFKTNPERAYCQAVINPKLAHLRAQLGSYHID